MSYFALTGNEIYALTGVLWINKYLNMENYKIYCEENERAGVLMILRKYNDIIIDNMSATGVSITIERDDAGTFYDEVMQEIDREVYRHRQERSNLASDGYQTSSGAPAEGMPG
jgi:hypothetical protein